MSEPFPGPDQMDERIAVQTQKKKKKQKITTQMAIFFACFAEADLEDELWRTRVSSRRRFRSARLGRGVPFALVRDRDFALGFDLEAAPPSSCSRASSSGERLLVSAGGASAAGAVVSWAGAGASSTAACVSSVDGSSVEAEKVCSRSSFADSCSLADRFD